MLHMSVSSDFFLPAKVKFYSHLAGINLEPVHTALFFFIFAFRFFLALRFQC